MLVASMLAYDHLELLICLTTTRRFLKTTSWIMGASGLQIPTLLPQVPSSLHHHGVYQKPNWSRRT